MELLERPGGRADYMRLVEEMRKRARRARGRKGLSPARAAKLEGLATGYEAAADMLSACIRRGHGRED